MLCLLLSLCPATWPGWMVPVGARIHFTNPHIQIYFFIHIFLLFLSYSKNKGITVNCFWPDTFWPSIVIKVSPPASCLTPRHTTFFYISIYKSFCLRLKISLEPLIFTMHKSLGASGPLSCYPLNRNCLTTIMFGENQHIQLLPAMSCLPHVKLRIKV